MTTLLRPYLVTDKEALTHRGELNEAFPSLQKAGRAYEAIRAALDGMPSQIVDSFRSDTTTFELIGSKHR